MGLFSKMGGGARNPFFKGNGDLIVAVMSVNKFKSKRTKFVQTITTFRVLARSPETDFCCVGKDYVHRFCLADAKFPESDEAKFYTLMAAIEGIPVGADYYAEAIDALGLNADDYDLNTEKGLALAEIFLDEKLKELADSIQADEGVSRKGRGLQIALKSGEPKEDSKERWGFCNIYPTPIPTGWVEDGELLSEAIAALEAEGWVLAEGE